MVKKILLVLGLWITIAVIAGVAWFGPRNLIGALTYVASSLASLLNLWRWIRFLR